MLVELAFRLWIGDGKDLDASISEPISYNYIFLGSFVDCLCSLPMRIMRVNSVCFSCQILKKKTQVLVF